MNILKIAFRNLNRQKRRSVLLVIAIVFAFFIVTFIDGMSAGAMKSMEYQLAKVIGGHVYILGAEKPQDRDEDDSANMLLRPESIALAQKTVKEAGIEVLYTTARTTIEGSFIFEGKTLQSRVSGCKFDEEKELLDSFQLLTTKPVLYVCNVDEKSAKNGNAYVEQVKDAVKGEDAEVIVLAVATEADITELESYEERQMFLEDIGLEEPGASKLIRAAYHLLNLQTYFTAGVKEVRAWTIHQGDTAPQAAGVIHTDFEKGFIRAEVIAYNDFITYGSEAKVKEAGKMRVEGKEYIVKDGDIMHFRFNV